MKEKYVVISPCFNEEKLIAVFLNRLEEQLVPLDKHFTVIMVDDGSTDSTKEILKNYKFKSECIELKPISLYYNSGHQSAIKQGLRYAADFDAKGYIVMDSDGEDDPAAIKELVAIKEFDVVFVTRGKRKENLKFKLGYFFYKMLFELICGKQINFGNYSMISNKVLKAVSRQNFFHYAAFLSKLRFKQSSILFDRQKRIEGNSKMVFNSLVFHGLKSLIEYSEELLYFIIKIFSFTFVLLLFWLIVMFYKKFVSHEAILGWTSTLGATLLNSTLIMLGTIVISLLILSIKNSSKQNDNNYEEIK